MNNSGSLFARVLPAIGLHLSPYSTSWIPTSSRVAGDSSNNTRATEVSASRARTERRTGEAGMGSASPVWNPVKAATARRNTRVSLRRTTCKPLNRDRLPPQPQFFLFISVFISAAVTPPVPPIFCFPLISLVYFFFF